MSTSLRRNLFILAVLALVAWPAVAQDGGQPDIYDEEADARELIADALEHAKTNNRRVLIQWGANWCGWCHLLHDLFEENAAVRRKLLYEYDVVLIDVGRFDRNEDLIAQYGAELEGNGIPYLTILDADGEVVHNQPTGPLEAEVDGKPGHDPEAVVAMLSEHQAEYLPAESVLAEGLARAREEGKRLFLSFGAPWCGWCHRLERILATEDVAELFGRDFMFLKIDLERTIGGPDVMERYRQSARGGIPWFVIVDDEAEPIVTSEWGEAGNLGCPWTDEEIAGFAEVLSAATRTLSEEDLASLIEAWKAAKEAEESN